MQLSLLYFDGCPHWQLARDRLQYAIHEAGIGDVRIDLTSVASSAEAEQRGLRGSPTILIGGDDPFADPGVPAGWSCRIFRTEDGPEGSPSVAQLVEALRSASDRALAGGDATSDASCPASDPPGTGTPGL